MRCNAQSPVPQAQDRQPCNQDNHLSMINQNLPGFASNILGQVAATDQGQMINKIFDSSMQARQQFNAYYNSNQASKTPISNL